MRNNSNNRLNSSPKISTTCSKTIIMSWLRSITTDLPHNFRIQDLGDGSIYCQIINYYHPGTISLSKIVLKPKSQYEMLNNLRNALKGLFQLGINIPFQVNKLMKRKFQQNWAVINGFYKKFEQLEETILKEEVNHNNKIFKTPPKHQGQQSPRCQNTNFAVPYNQLLLPFNVQLPIWTPPQQLINCYPNNTLETPRIMDNKYQQNVEQPKIDILAPKTTFGQFQSNQNAIVDRMKEILLKDTHDTEKVKQLKMLVGLQVETEVIKIEDDDMNYAPLVFSDLIKIQEVEDWRHEKAANEAEKIESKNSSSGQHSKVEKKEVVSLVSVSSSSSLKPKKPFRV